MTNDIREGEHWTCAHCNADNVAHGYHWCHQVCAQCITPHWEKGEPRQLRPDGFYDARTRLAVQANIATNKGRYIPEFTR